MSRSWFAWLVALLVSLAGCDKESPLAGAPASPNPGSSVPASGSAADDSAPSTPAAPATPTAEPTPAPPAPNSVLWKRVDALRADLVRALGLPAEELCTELGSLDCFDKVHLTTLGGNEPFVLTQFEPIKEPAATTAISVERVALSACNKRLTEDETSPVVFKFLPAQQELSAPADAGYLAQLDAQTKELYRRLLARDPADAEVRVHRKFATNGDGMPVKNRDVSLLSCYSIASSREFLFL